MEFVRPRVARLALRTPTLPPATHTNTWILGGEDLTVVDPASPYEDEQQRLLTALLEAVDRGARLRRLFLTHHHADHVSGARALRDGLRDRGIEVPIAAHAATATRVAAGLVDEGVDDGDELLPGVTALFTPGHAPGHLCLVGEGWVVAGDLVAGEGTILLDPTEGDLDDYLASLARVASGAPEVLLPAHGPPLPHAVTVLSTYVAHRHARSEQVLAALGRAGWSDAAGLVPDVYRGVDPRAWPIAAIQVETHLRWLQRHGRAEPEGGGYRAVGR